jgi:hypothetical protein
MRRATWREKQPTTGHGPCLAAARPLDLVKSRTLAGDGFADERSPHCRYERSGSRQPVRARGEGRAQGAPSKTGAAAQARRGSETPRILRELETLDRSVASLWEDRKWGDVRRRPGVISAGARLAWGASYASVGGNASKPRWHPPHEAAMLIDVVCILESAAARRRQSCLTQSAGLMSAEGNVNP